MYLKCHRRFKDGKEHRYWSIAEKRRCAGGRVVDRQVLYLGEINASQKEAWLRCIEGFDEGKGAQMRLALFPAETSVPEHARSGGIQVCLIMDRGIPTEEHVESMRARPISYLVGTPKGRLTKLEKALATLCLSEGARGGGSQAPGARPRALCVGAESSTRVQGAGHAPTAPETSMAAAQRIATRASKLRDAAAETGRCPQASGSRVVIGQAHATRNAASARAVAARGFQLRAQ